MIFRKRITYSSRLMESAYAAALKGKAGHRGDEHFDDWLDDQEKEAAGRPDLHSGFICGLRAEYFRGVEAHEAALKAARAIKTAEAPGWFKDHRIEAIEGGEYVVPGLDRESRFDNVTEAKRFIRAYART